MPQPLHVHPRADRIGRARIVIRDVPARLLGLGTAFNETWMARSPSGIHITLQPFASSVGTLHSRSPTSFPIVGQQMRTRIVGLGLEEYFRRTRPSRSQRDERIGSGGPFFPSVSWSCLELVAKGHQYTDISVALGARRYRTKPGGLLLSPPAKQASRLMSNQTSQRESGHEAEADMSGA